MRRFASISLAVVVSALVPMNVGSAHHEQDRQLSISQLGPDPFVVLPDTLERLVRRVPAAVIARIVGTGGLRLEEIPVAGTSHRIVEGYATYRVVILDIVFHKDPKSTPPLVVGSEIELTQGAGRESAEAFLANRIPVAAGDECLLFLWLRPHGWGFLRWPGQFRKSREFPSKAEMLADSRAFRLTPEWFGGSVPATVVDEVVRPNWDGLVGEVRRLGRR